jgi:hypothetical protein
VRPGFIIRLEDDGFDLESPRVGVVGVRVTPQTRFVPDKRISVGDHVIVFGPMVDGRIQAFGVRETPPPMYAIRVMPR